LITQFVRQVGWLFALQDTIDVSGRAPVLVEDIWPVGDQAAVGDEGTGGVDRGQSVPLYSKPFAFRTVWAAGEERNVTSALPASV
jgi:hypothetical protein